MTLLPIGLSHQTRETSAQKCPCCDGPLSDVFYVVRDVPVHSCLMLDDAESAENFPSSDVELVQCLNCGFVTNTVFDRKWSAYAPNYEDQQSFSPTFNSFAGKLAKDWVERHNLQGKSAVEVGCSKGDFMALLCEAGMDLTIGIDPSAVPGRIPSPSRGAMKFIADYYQVEHQSIEADALICRHTLEHIRDVQATLSAFGSHAKSVPGCRILIEVPDAMRVWKEAAIEDIYYEHCSYFTPGVLARAARTAGLAVTDLRVEYNDQYLVLEASTNPEDDKSFAIEEPVEETLQMVQDFHHKVEQIRSVWTRVFKEHEGPIAIWGSGSKCVSILKTLGIASHVDAIVDINPHRTGKFAPRSPIAISAPETLRALQPKLIVIMNGIYRNEIAEDLRAMGLEPDLMVLGA